ncbi:MAG: alkaline shock response membrane anchor protein AmaP [Aerococcus sp.]|nr:alkaline shock response membrane anchor protein AmaP [Aerococcus sp.]
MGGFRRFIRIVWTLVAFLALGTAIAALTSFGGLTEFVWNHVLVNESLVLAEIVVLGVLLCAVVVLFIHGLLAPSTKNYVAVKNGRGTLTLTKTAVASAAAVATRRFSSVLDEDVNVTMYKRPEETTVNVTAYTEDAADQTGLSERIQEAVQKSVERTLGVTVGTVNVTMQEAEKRAESKPILRRKQPRVK